MWSNRDQFKPLPLRGLIMPTIGLLLRFLPKPTDKVRIMLPKDPYSPRKPDKRIVSTSSNKDKPAFIGRREAIVVLMITFALAVILFSFEGPENEDNLGAPFAMTEMPYPDLKQLPNTVGSDRIELFKDRASEYIATPERIFGQPLEIMIEWSRQRMALDIERASHTPALDPHRPVANEL